MKPAVNVIKRFLKEIKFRFPLFTEAAKLGHFKNDLEFLEYVFCWTQMEGKFIYKYETSTTYPLYETT